MTQEVSCLHSHESVQPLLVLQQLLLPPPSVDLLEPAELLRSSLLLLLRAHTAARQLPREGKLHAVNLPLVKLWAAPLFHLYGWGGGGGMKGGLTWRALLDLGQLS